MAGVPRYCSHRLRSVKRQRSRVDAFDLTVAKALHADWIQKNVEKEMPGRGEPKLSA
jgi:hypothetical protein